MNFVLPKVSSQMASSYDAVSNFLRAIMRLSLVICVPLWPSVAQAWDVGAALKVGTPGFGGDVTIGVNKTFNARMGINFFSYTFDEEEEGDDADIALEIGLLSFPLVFLVCGKRICRGIKMCRGCRRGIGEGW